MYEFNNDHFYEITDLHLDKLGIFSIKEALVNVEGKNIYSIETEVSPLRKKRKEGDTFYNIEGCYAKINLINKKGIIHYKKVYKGGLIQYFEYDFNVNYEMFPPKNDLERNMNHYRIKVKGNKNTEPLMVKEESLF